LPWYFRGSETSSDSICGGGGALGLRGMYVALEGPCPWGKETFWKGRTVGDFPLREKRVL